MSAERTPTTEKVRSEYQAGVTNCGCCLDERPEDAAEFDRWLAAERARVAADTAETIARDIDLTRRRAKNFAPGHYAGLAHAARIARDHGGTP